MVHGYYVLIVNLSLFSYSILAADESKGHKEPLKSAEAIMKKLVSTAEVTDENFRVGTTKVFFKAGILAHLEDLRDQKLAKIISGIQANARWYVEKIAVKRRREQM